MWGFTKDACGIKLLPMTILAYPVDCVFLPLIEDLAYCHLFKNPGDSWQDSQISKIPSDL